MGPLAPACLLWHLPCQLARPPGWPAAVPRHSPEPGSPQPSLALAACSEQGWPHGYVPLRKGQCRCPGDRRLSPLTSWERAVPCPEAAARTGCPDPVAGPAARAASGASCSPELARDVSPGPQLSLVLGLDGLVTKGSCTSLLNRRAQQHPGSPGGAWQAALGHLRQARTCGGCTCLRPGGPGPCCVHGLAWGRGQRLGSEGPVLRERRGVGASR